MTIWQFKVLLENLDTLIESSKSTSNSEYSITTHKALLKSTMKEHATNMEKANKTVADSSTVCKETTEKSKN